MLASADSEQQIERRDTMSTVTWSLRIICAGLLLLHLPAEVQAQFYYTTNNGALTIDQYTGSGGAVTIPSTINGLKVVSIGELAFSDCYNLTSVTIPDSVTSIGEEAFSGSYDLTSVTIPDSVTYMGAYAFSACYGLNNVVIGNGVTFLDGTFDDCTYLASVKIGGSVTSIGEYTFINCAVLTGLAIPNSVTNIGMAAFQGCTALSSLTIPNGVISIGDSAFDGCTSLRNIVIGNGVMTIGSSAFFDCTNLTSITMGDSVTDIGSYAFSGGPGFGGCPISSMVIPNTVINIGEYAFSYCYNLAEIALSDNLTSIQEGAFEDCTSLSSVTIPASVTSIENDAFAGTVNLTGVYFLGNAPGSGTDPYSVFEGGTVYYVAGTTGWGATYDGLPTKSFTPQTGSLEVVISPAAAVSAGAQWQTGDGVWRNSGTTVTGLLAGIDLVTFKSISGWNTPSNQVVAVNGNETTMTTGVYAQTVGGLVGYWKLNEGTGLVAYDYSGNGNNGIIEGPTWANGGGLYFNGALSDQVVIADSPALDPINAITIAAWIYADDWNGDRRIVDKGLRYADHPYTLTAQQGVLSFGVGIGNTNYASVSTTLPSVGAWHHVAGTYDGSAMQLYIDGQLMESSVASGVVRTTTTPLGIGNKLQTQYASDDFHGIIDEVRLYARALSLPEIQEIACVCSLSPPAITIGALGTSGSVTVSGGSNCNWTASSNVGWINITSGNSGLGDGAVSYSVGSNSGAARTGTITIAGQTFTVNQAAAISDGLSFAGVVQKCSTKIVKKTDTTNTTCAVTFTLVVRNNGAGKSPKTSILLWLAQDGTLNPTAGPIPLTKRVNALKPQKTAKIKVKAKFHSDQTGTFIFVTDTSTNILASVEVPTPD
jgi:hypothetical protein